MPPPRAISCELCGKQFFKHSYGIHLKQCREKRVQSFTNCGKCNLPVSNDEYSEHFEQCTVKRKQRIRREREKVEEDKCEPDKNEASESGDFRIACQICARRFAPPRISKHELICRRVNTKKPRKKFPSSSAMRIKNTEFAAFNGKKIKPNNDSKSNSVNYEKRNWRLEHAKMFESITQNRLISEFKKRDISLSKLPQLGADLTSFMESSGNQEIRSAIKVVLQLENRPNLKTSYFGTKEAMMLSLGDKVVLKNRRSLGIIKFIGSIEGFFKGYWVGVELLDGDGCHSGEFQKTKYFDCKPMKGLFVRPNKVTKLDVILRASKRSEQTLEKEFDLIQKRKETKAEKLRNEVRLESPRNEVKECENNRKCENKASKFALLKTKNKAKTLRRQNGTRRPMK